jgi:hypothetical protein
LDVTMGMLSFIFINDARVTAYQLKDGKRQHDSEISIQRNVSAEVLMHKHALSTPQRHRHVIDSNTMQRLSLRAS